jgi:hydantoinase/carbamoylase family amidase
VSELAADIEAAAAFGADDDGVTRFAWSRELFAVYDWLAERLRRLGLEAEVDAAGNLIGRWELGSGAPIVVGSHLDTVPHGGRYDGALGVLAGLHALRLLRARDFEPRRPLWLVSFMDEEGARFGTALFGSRAFAGEDVRTLGDRRDRDGVSLPEAMGAAGFALDRAREARRIDEIGSYLELHIEQGPVLEGARVDVGIVTAIVGLIAYRARMLGEANHAGTTPMAVRRDALAGAARVVLALRDEALRREGMTANVGKIQVHPGGSNVVPGACEFTIDVRAPTAEALASAEQHVHETLARVSEEEDLGVELEEIYRLAPVPLDQHLQETLERAAGTIGAKTMRLPSGAGHDAMVLARHVPTAMVFVPSRRGISHSPDEFTAPEQCELGARVLAEALAFLAA